MVESTFASEANFISLGLNCEVAHQLRIHRKELDVFAPLKSIDGRIPAGAHFFDWNISPISAVIKILSADFEGVFEKTNIVVSDKRDGSGFNYVIDQHSGLMFHHIFTRTSNIVTTDTVEVEFEERQQKVMHLISKFKKVLNEGQNVIFLRRANDSPSEIKRLHAVLSERMSDRRFILANIRSDASDVICNLRGVAIYNMPLTSKWYGDVDAWRQALDHYQQTLIASE